jgi:hypothetical protein
MICRRLRAAVVTIEVAKLATSFFVRRAACPVPSQRFEVLAGLWIISVRAGSGGHSGTSR